MVCCVVNNDVCSITVGLFLSPGRVSPNNIANITAILGCLASFPMNATIFVVGVPLFVLTLLGFNGKFVFGAIVTANVDSVLLSVLGLSLPGFGFSLVLTDVFNNALIKLNIDVVVLHKSSANNVRVVTGLINVGFPCVDVKQLVLLFSFLIITLSTVICGGFRDTLCSIMALCTYSGVVSLILCKSSGKGILCVVDSGARSVICSVLGRVKHKIAAVSVHNNCANGRKHVVVYAIETRRIRHICLTMEHCSGGTFVIIYSTNRVLNRKFGGWS